jgi:hypothetical protein
MHDPNTPNAMQAPLTHEEKWEEAEEYFADCLWVAKRFYWKAAGRPVCPEEDYLPPELWENPPHDPWQELAA